MPAVRLLRHGDLFQISPNRQRYATHAQPADLRQTDAARLDANISANERKGVRAIGVALEPRKSFALRLALDLSRRVRSSF